MLGLRSNAASRSCRRLPLAAAALLLGAASSVSAQSTATYSPAASAPAALAGTPAVDTALGARYGAGGFRRFFLGAGYRELWELAVHVPVLDLRTFAGGLRPTRDGGGKQTRSLRFQGADGREYLLRSSDKEAGNNLPAGLRGTLVEGIFQDQTSATHPFAAPVADRLTTAVGLPSLAPMLVMLPDDPALGEFRERFAGRIGYLQERPEGGADGARGFAGFQRVLGTEAMLRRRREHPEERLDVRRYLTARLLDLVLGDWDRHRDQWRWGRIDKDSAWQPIPRDRDYAFARHDGLFRSILRRSAIPNLVRFDDRRLPVTGLTWYGRDLDRELLPRLEWPVWDSVLTEIRSGLTDGVIAAAVAEVPAAVPDEHRAWLAATLRSRREHLPDAARRFYRTLAVEADLHATDAAERITVEGLAGGGVQVDVAGAGAGTRISRRFDPSVTREIRVYAHGGADTVASRGEPGRIRVRAIGGEGHDAVVRAGGPAVDFHQDGAEWRPPLREADPPPARDWGGYTFSLPVLAATSDAGLIVGAQFTHIDYGFRKLPFSSRTSVQAIFGTGNARPGLAVTSVIQTASPAVRFVVNATGGGVEVLRFYTLGNESAEARDREFHRVRNWQVSLAPAIEVGQPHGPSLGMGPSLRYVDSELDADRLIGTVRPFGSGGFAELGAHAYARWDVRDVPTNPRRGLLLELKGDFVPAILDATESFGGASATATGYLTPPGESSPTLELRAGSHRVWGLYPWFEAARIGGDGTVRGYSTGRFLGDASAFGSAELRVPLARARLLVSGQLGVLGFADAGRVYLDGESSHDWHEAFGGGLWFTWLGQANVVSLAVARSPERTTLTLRGGVGF